MIVTEYDVSAYGMALALAALALMALVCAWEKFVLAKRRDKR